MSLKLGTTTIAGIPTGLIDTVNNKQDILTSDNAGNSIKIEGDVISGYSFNRGAFTIVGTPSITDDGIASGFSTSNAICVSSDLINYQADNYEIDIPFIYNSSSQSTILQSGSSSNYKIAIIINTNKIALFLGNGNSWTIANLKYGKSTLAVGTSYICKFIRKDGYYKINLLNKSTNTETEEISIQSSSLVPSSHYSTSFCSRDVYTNGWGIGNLTCNLAELKYFVDGVEVFSGSKKLSSVPHLITCYVNGTSGYNIWSNGYCEQWGICTSPNYQTITFLKTFSNINYNAQITARRTSTTQSGDANDQILYNSCTVSSLYVYINNTTNNGIYWRACGYLADGQY